MQAGREEGGGEEGGGEERGGEAVLSACRGAMEG